MVGVKNPVKDIPLLPIPNGDKAPTARDILIPATWRDQVTIESRMQKLFLQQM